MHRSRRRPALPLLVLTSVLTALLSVTSSNTLAAPAVATARASDDASGRAASTRRHSYDFQFRTMDTGNDPTAAQERRCTRNLGLPEGTPLAISLDAALFGFRVDAASGRLTSEATRRIGSGYICSAGQPTSDATVASYAFATLPGIGTAQLRGGCDLVPVAAQPGAAFFRCTLRPLPDPRTGLVGGIAVSNSLVDATGPLGPSPLTEDGNGTGSVWTSHLVFSRRIDGLSAPRPRAAPVQNRSHVAFGGDGFHFFVGAAPAGGGTGGDQCDEPLRLRSYQPRVSTSFTDTRRTGERVARLALCRTGETWQATERLRDSTRRLTVRAAGSCDRRTDGVVFTSCALSVLPDADSGIRGGVLSSIATRRQPSGKRQVLWTAAVVRQCSTTARGCPRAPASP